MRAEGRKEAMSVFESAAGAVTVARGDEDLQAVCMESCGTALMAKFPNRFNSETKF
jgi:hypothetical protein